MRHRGDARQRFASEAQRRNSLEIVGPLDLARGMTLDRESRVVRIHPVAIVLDPNEPFSPELHGDRNAPGPRINRVFDQLLDDGRWTLDDFACGDLVGEIGGKLTDSSHQNSFTTIPCAGTARASSR